MVFWSPLDPFGTPLEPLWDPPELTLGSLGTPLDPSDEPLGPPWAAFGTPLGPRPKNTQKRGLRLHFLGPLFSLKSRVFSNAKWRHFFDTCLKHVYLILGMFLESKNTRNLVQHEKCVFLENERLAYTRAHFSTFWRLKHHLKYVKNQGEKWLTF